MESLVTLPGVVHGPLLTRASTTRRMMLALPLLQLSKHLTLVRSSTPYPSSSSFSSSSSSSDSSPSSSTNAADNKNKSKGRVFVAGATGKTGRRIVDELISHGFQVRAGVRDLNAAKSVLPPPDQNLELVQADVTEGADKLATAIGAVDSVICATGFRPSLDFLAPWKVDNFGTVNLIEACKKNGITRFVLVSSILVNGAAMGQLLNPAYIVLNIFGLTLIAKLQAEKYIRQSGINYTIVRPGGLRDDPPSGNIVMTSEDTLYEGSISRDSVAFICAEALSYPEASYKVVEIVSRGDAPYVPAQELFAAVK